MFWSETAPLAEDIDRKNNVVEVPHLDELATNAQTVVSVGIFCDGYSMGTVAPRVISSRQLQ